MITTQVRVSSPSDCMAALGVKVGDGVSVATGVTDGTTVAVAVALGRLGAGSVGEASAATVGVGDGTGVGVRVAAAVVGLNERVTVMMPAVGVIGALAARVTGGWVGIAGWLTTGWLMD